ncbi:MAG: FAD-dependent thymidylate synthase [Treponemataceae bacterium]
MAHCIVNEAEKILDKEFPVLDHGFVRLVDYLGGDARIVQAARVSYGEGTKTVREDAALIDYLLRNQHTSPFEQVVFTFHIKMPIFVARQWVRHRTARLNEVSGRYSVLKNEAYLPEKNVLALQSKDNKQGRRKEKISDELAEKTLEVLKQGQELAFENYEMLLSDDIAKELARINLPLSTYTEIYWQMDLHNLFHFLKLRCDAHAQKEIRDYAFVILGIVEKVVPIATKSFKAHVLNSIVFSDKEVRAIKYMLDGKTTELNEREKERLAEKLDSVLDE